MDEEKLAATPLQMTAMGNECLAVSNDGKILVSRHDGFYILNSLGSISWQADSILIPEASHFDGRTPQVFGNYGIFSGLTATGSVSRIYKLDTPGTYSERFPSGDHSTCEPVFSSGYLFIADVAGQRVKICKLKEDL